MPVKFIQKSLLALLFFFIGLTTLSTTTYAQTFTAGPGIDQFTPLPKTLSRVGERLSVRVTFNETVMVKGRPTIPFSIGNGTRQCTRSRVLIKQPFFRSDLRLGLRGCDRWAA